jgi:tetratricopeptide (TPR) repeat protein
MRRLLIALLLAAAAPAAADECPAAPDIADRIDALIAEIRTAPNESAARPVSNRMWELWTRAPDGHAQALLDEGMARIRLADYEGAVAALDALVTYCPHYAEGYNQRAFANFLQGRFGLALEDLDLALERSPRHVGALSGKALTLLGLGRVQAGQAALRDALELNPWLSERAFLDEPPGEEL